jgi:hypothetical protein
MESKFPAFALPPGDVGYAARLDMQWLHNFAGRVEAEKFKDEWNNADGNVDNVESDDDVDTESMEGVAVVKSDTSESFMTVCLIWHTANYAAIFSFPGLSMCTFIDNLEELREHRYDSDVDELETSSLSPLRRIVRNGVGDITPTDVLVAHTAKGMFFYDTCTAAIMLMLIYVLFLCAAPILAYEVGILPEAARQAEVIIMFDSHWSYYILNVFLYYFHVISESRGQGLLFR